MRCAVQVPEHKAARHVPDPDVAVRTPEPTARFMPLASVTWMAPASATRPDAVTVALFEATWPLLIPIETDAPLVQAAFDELICTFQAPSNVAAADGAAKPNAASSEAASRDFQDLAMTCPFGLDTIKVSQWLHKGCDCHHAPEHGDRAQRKPRVAAGLRLNAL
jgi:hypothetical protein